jgi:two-component system alkaline phosphatase synthesis response regulator PhoP
MVNKINKKILIVEDEKDLLDLLAHSFTDQGFSVVVAHDGQDGLSVAEKEKPDLIILDILMPKMDGISMAKELQENGVKIPIIFLTNFGDAEHISSAIEVNKSDYIIKSDLQIHDIISRVKTRLEIK